MSSRRAPPQDDGLQMAFIDGGQSERLCEPLKQYIEARGGEVRLNAPLKEIMTAEDGTVSGLQMRDGAAAATHVQPRSR